jgi:hypothetical protein
MKIFRIEFFLSNNGSISQIYLFMKTDYCYNMLADKLSTIQRKHSHPWLGHGIIFYGVDNWPKQ